MKKYLCCLILIFSFTFSSFAQDSLQVMFYNLFRFPTSPPANREYLLQDIVDSVKPDLLMVCELQNLDGANRILNTSFRNQEDSFSRATFEYSISAIDDPLQQLVFYNTRKLILLRQQTFTTTVRDINHYTFILNLEHLPNDSVYLEVFVTHLKSSTGPANRNLRLSMIDTFVQALQDIPAHHHVLLAGDFNFYDSDSEPAYQKILDTSNHIIMVDPIDSPGLWHDNPLFAAIHTQATRTSSQGFGIGGATGGMDDRFDFIMMSKNSIDAPEFSYIPETYKAYGNNGNCFDKSIHDTSCTGIYSQEIREKLHNMSDHTPVIMRFQTPMNFNPVLTKIKNPETNPYLYLPRGNGCQNELWVQLKEPSNSTSALILYNILGQKVIEKNLEKHTNPQAIDVRHLKSGIYYLQLKNHSGSALKIIKR